MHLSAGSWHPSAAICLVPPARIAAAQTKRCVSVCQCSIEPHLGGLCAHAFALLQRTIVYCHSTCLHVVFPYLFLIFFFFSFALFSVAASENLHSPRGRGSASLDASVAHLRHWHPFVSGIAACYVSFSIFMPFALAFVCCALRD